MKNIVLSIFVIGLMYGALSATGFSWNPERKAARESAVTMGCQPERIDYYLNAKLLVEVRKDLIEAGHIQHSAGWVEVAAKSNKLPGEVGQIQFWEAEKLYQTIRHIRFAETAGVGYYASPFATK